MTLNKIKSILFPAAKDTILHEARLTLLYLMLGANVVKGTIFAINDFLVSNNAHIVTSIALIGISLVLIATLRLLPAYTNAGIHLSVAGMILLSYYRVFNHDIGADVISIQLIIMVITCSFYGLNSRWGLFYSTIAGAAPILINYTSFRLTGLDASSKYLNDAYIVINFLVILLSHLYFRRQLFGIFRQKDFLNKELSELADSKSIFLSTMAHELRTPLNSVIGIASILIAENHDEKQKERLDILKFSAGNLLSLINDILDINKLAAGKLELESAPFNCHSLIQSVVASASTQAKEKSLDLRIEVDPQMETRTYLGDSTRLTQILFNLVGNAVKFTSSGVVEISAKILDEPPGRDLIRFSVLDTGIGISENQQRLIFEPFVQASSNTTRKFGGTGLGLSIVKQLVEMFGGEVHLKSELGNGTEIYFDLWLRHAEGDFSMTTESTADNIQLSRLKVLLVEDNMMNIYFMKQLFARWGIIADIAENGQEALNMVTVNTYDVVLMDMQMPIMDGMEAARRIRELPDPVRASTYIIALTASVSDEVKNRVKRNGMNDYMTKPFEIEELKQKLTKLHL